MKRIGLFLLVVVLAVGVAGCGGGGDAPTTGTLRIVNNTSNPISVVNLSPADLATWGPNQIATDIPAGGTRDIVTIPPGLYDFRAILSSGFAETGFDITISAGQTTTVTVNQPTTGTLRIVNNTSNPISVVNLSPADLATWGPNQIATDIPAGGTRDIVTIPPGLYDFRAILSNGLTATLYNTTISAGQIKTVTLNQPPNGGIKTVNNSGLPITQLYITLSSSSSWGSNQLTSQIPSGGSLLIQGIPPGYYDYKAVRSDSAYGTSFGIGITAGNVFTVTLLP